MQEPHLLNKATLLATGKKGDNTMISTKATTGIEHIDFNKVCNLVKNDLMTKFADTVRSVGKVKHKVNPAIPTISINFKRKAPKNTPVDTNTINNMVEFLTADLKCANLIPSTFHTTILKLEQKPFTTILSINLKP